MSDPLNDNFGQIGFESCSILQNLGSLVWFILLYFLKTFFLAFNNQFVIKNFYMRRNHKRLNKIGASISKSRKATFWNGFLEYIDGLFLVCFMTSAIRLEQTNVVGRKLSDDIEDVLMITVMVIIPGVYFYLSIKMWKNYDALKDKESPEAEFYGHFSKNVALDEVSKLVGITASFLSTIRAIVMCTVLVFF